MNSKIISVGVVALLVLIMYKPNPATFIEHPEFTKWKQQFKVFYPSDDENIYRQNIFLQNLKIIEKENRLNNSYKLGINQFTALKPQQFETLYLKKIPTTNLQRIIDEEGTITINIDWVAAGAVTSVKNQGVVNSAVLYSTLGGIEGLSKIADGTLKEFNPQTLVACVGSTGIFDAYYKYITQNGIDQNYTPNKCTGSFKISGTVSTSTCADLTNSLSSGPVSIAVDATNWSLYAGGVFTNCKTNLNHAALLVGATDAYWKIKNDWGVSWGEQGYIRIATGNTCGVCTLALRPVK